MRHFLQIFVLAALLVLPAYLSAQENKTIKLQAPQTSGGMPLMQALNERRSVRNFTDQKLSEQQLSNLLWAANGINRPAEKKHTAPSARNKQEIDVYVTTADGTYLYDAINNSLIQLNSLDLRSQTGGQPFVGDAAINLVFVADMKKVGSPKTPESLQWCYADAAFISQNVYLFCASEGLATVVRGYVPKDKLAQALGLNADQEIILAQTVGFEKK